MFNKSETAALSLPPQTARGAHSLIFFFCMYIYINLADRLCLVCRQSAFPALRRRAPRLCVRGWRHGRRGIKGTRRVRLPGDRAEACACKRDRGRRRCAWVSAAACGLAGWVGRERAGVIRKIREIERRTGVSMKYVVALREKLCGKSKCEGEVDHSFPECLSWLRNFLNEGEFGGMCAQRSG